MESHPCTWQLIKVMSKFAALAAWGWSEPWQSQNRYWNNTLALGSKEWPSWSCAVADWGWGWHQQGENKWWSNTLAHRNSEGACWSGELAERGWCYPKKGQNCQRVTDMTKSAWNDGYRFCTKGLFFYSLFIFLFPCNFMVTLATEYSAAELFWKRRVERIAAARGAGWSWGLMWMAGYGSNSPQFPSQQLLWISYYMVAGLNIWLYIQNHTNLYPVKTELQTSTNNLYYINYINIIIYTVYGLPLCTGAPCGGNWWTIYVIHKYVFILYV